MYIKNRMTADPYTIESDAPITEVIALMHEKNLRRIPVTENGKAVGIITNTDIQRVSPTESTSLSVYEINYLLSKTYVRDAMSKNLITITTENLLEEAAVIMRDNKISSLVVVGEESNVQGIITESNIFDAFIDLLGFREGGTRISIEATDMPGVLEDIGRIFKENNANITHIADFQGWDDKAEVIIRTKSLDTTKIQKELKERKYKILSVIESE